MKRLAIVLVCCAAVGAALAEHDNSVWPTFRANAGRLGSVAAPGPATNLAWQFTTDYGPGAGGFSVSSTGDIYYLCGEDDEVGGVDGPTYVFRLDPADGKVLAQSPNLEGTLGTYGGVAIGKDEVFVIVYGGANNAKVVALDKLTLAVNRSMTDLALVGPRGTPYIGDVLNSKGHYNLYFPDRNGGAVHAMDSIDGTIMWTFTTLTSATAMSQMGPFWVEGGKQMMALFDNSDFMPGYLLRDDGNTATQIWNAGPTSFNWWGSGALSKDGERIYVTTFNDNAQDTLWAINVSDGSAAWSVPGNKGTPEELNFFGRPAVWDNRVYCGGALGVVACFVDNGTSYTKAWEHRDLYGEHTCISVAHTPAGDTYVYTAKQVQDPGGPNPDFGEYLVLRDDGNSYTEILRTDLNGTMQRSLYATSGMMIDAEGSVYVGSGWPNDPGLGPATVYKFSALAPACPGDFDCDGDRDFDDIDPFVEALNTQKCNCPNFANCDPNGDGKIDFDDIDPFVGLIGVPCP